MQTFLPYTDYAKSAESLDKKRLNKQILECYQILKVLSSNDPKAAWRNHPAVLMWRGHEFALWNYVQAMILEADKRGIKVDKNSDNLDQLRKQHGSQWGFRNPVWMSDPEAVNHVTITHRANLFLKDPVLYPQFRDAVTNEYNQPCCPDCKYYWVSHVAKRMVA